MVQLDSSRSMTSIVTRKGQVCSYGLHAFSKLVSKDNFSHDKLRFALVTF